MSYIMTTRGAATFGSIRPGQGLSMRSSIGSNLRSNTILPMPRRGFGSHPHFAMSGTSDGIWYGLLWGGLFVGGMLFFATH
jgi:hypothetical protein